MRFRAGIGERLDPVVIDRVDGIYVVEINGRRFEIEAQKLEGDFYSILTGGRSYEVSVERVEGGYRVRQGAGERIVHVGERGRGPGAKRAGGAGPEKIVSQMPGKVARVLVAEGDRVESGQGVVVVEAMKMENEITASRAGVVRTVAVEPGQPVENGALLLIIE